MNDDSSCKDSTTDTCLATDERDIIEDIVVTLTGDNLENSSVYKPTSNEETEVVAGTSDRLQDIGTSNPISQNKETTAAKLTSKRVQVKDLQALQRDYFIGEMEVQAEKKKYLAAKTEMAMQQTLFYKKMAAFFDDKKVIQWPSADEWTKYMYM